MIKDLFRALKDEVEGRKLELDAQSISQKKWLSESADRENRNAVKAYLERFVDAAKAIDDALMLPDFIPSDTKGNKDDCIGTTCETPIGKLQVYATGGKIVAARMTEDDK